MLLPLLTHDMLLVGTWYQVYILCCLLCRTWQLLYLVLMDTSVLDVTLPANSLLEKLVSLAGEET